MRTTERFDKALTFTADLHRNQYRKGGEIPYLGHLLGVCSIAIENGADEEEAIGALLHDSIEDQSGPFGGADKLRDHIRSEFGEKVLKIVEGCTDAETIPKPPWRTRKEAYLAHLPGASASVRLASASDKLHNARAILQDLRLHGEALWPRFTGGKAGSLWYYRALVEAYRLADDPGQATALIAELDRVVSEIEQVARGE